MTFLKIETSARFNRKLIKAGPTAAWLWLCGNLYCQEALTDGFISDETLDFLGVKGARKLVGALVTAGLWVEADGGWQVHDYLEHNRSADEVARLKEIRRENGKKGGRPKPKPNENQDGSARKTEPVSVSGSVSGSDSVSELEKRNAPIPDATLDQPNFDQMLRDLTAAYPSQGRSAGRMTQDAFLSVFLEREKDRPAQEVYRELLAAIENQKAGAQWMAGKVPNLTRWLNEGLYLQRHDPADVLPTVVKSRDPQWVIDARAEQARKATA